MEKITDLLKKISLQLDDGKSLINDDKIIAFQTSAAELEEKLDSIKEEGRDLRLGIVGEVKAGKSSFLNALIFDGEDILPKAPTPMTAALTKIRYSENPMAKIVFYTKEDWNAVISRSDKYDSEMKEKYREYESQFLSLEALRNSPGAALSMNVSQKMSYKEYERANRDQIAMEYRACKELTMMVERSGVDVDKCLGRDYTLDSAGSDRNEYLRTLDKFVGAGGIYTPLVKYTEIYIDNDMLKGVEIVDTPGLNDPILSRNRTTQNFLIECDAVFLMSYCGQFLGAEDMAFIVSSLPNDGIRKAVLIGSKFDSAISQFPMRRKPTFKQAYIGTLKNIHAQAKSNLDDVTVNEFNSGLIEQLRASLPPICVSSLAYTAAKRFITREQPTEQEALMVKNMKKYEGFTPDYETINGISNIDVVRKKVFEETRNEKDKLISERIADIESQQALKFARILDDILIQTSSNRSDLKTYDRDQLQKKCEDLKSSLDSVRIVVRNLFEKTALDSQWRIKELCSFMRKEVTNNFDIIVNNTIEVKTHESTTGMFFWKKKKEIKEDIRVKTCEVSEADRNLFNYHMNCIDIINKNFKGLIEIDKLKDSIKAVVLDAFEKADRNFDETRIIIPLENALGRITLSDIDLPLQKYTDMLDSKISSVVTNGVVKNQDIPVLKKAQDDVLKAMADDIIDLLESEGRRIDTNLQEQSIRFIDNIIAQLEGNLQKLEQLVDDKENKLKEFDRFEEIVKLSKKALIDTKELGASAV